MHVLCVWLFLSGAGGGGGGGGGVGGGVYVWQSSQTSSSVTNGLTKLPELNCRQVLPRMFPEI